MARSPEETQRRRDFLESCCSSFMELKKEDARGKGQQHFLYCSSKMLDNIVAYDFELVERVREKLDNPEHRIDRHKVASCLVAAIVFAQPLRSAKQLQLQDARDSNHDDKTEVNAEFALYTALNLLYDWHRAGGREFIVLARARKFIDEHKKWLTAAADYPPCVLFAQMFYLFEQLCFVEQEFARKSCRKMSCTDRLSEAVAP